MEVIIDFIVWDYVKNNDLMIVFKDVDMYDFSLVFGSFFKVIWF